MGRSFVVNASPLILLSRIGRLDLLTSLAETTAVPQRVLEELEVGAERDEAFSAVKTAAGLDIVPDVEVPEQIRLWDLGPGESQVLAYALTNAKLEAVLDDRAARRCARAFAVPYTGTLGVVIACRSRGLIAAARPVVGALQEQGIRLAPSLIEVALAEVGE